MTTAIKCGIIGLGYWGPNLLRNISGINTAEAVALCDRDGRRAQAMARQFAVPVVTDNPSDLFDSPDIDAIFIATPVRSHFPLAMAALKAGKHVFVEKPLAGSVAEAEMLVAEAESRRRCLMVDHVFVYSPAVRKMRDLVTGGDLGEILYYDSVRVNLGLFQHDVNVVWDLVVHDLSILDYVLDARPTAVATRARAHVRGQPENIAYLTFDFDGPMIAHFHVNWLAPVKVRRTLVCGTRRMILYDDLEPDEKIKIYDRGVDVAENTEDMANLQLGYRMGDMWAPVLSRREPLSVAVEHFASCVMSGETPITDGHAGLRIVRLLEAASRSAAEGGQEIRVGV